MSEQYRLTIGLDYKGWFFSLYSKASRWKIKECFLDFVEGIALLETGRAFAWSPRMPPTHRKETHAHAVR